MYDHYRIHMHIKVGENTMVKLCIAICHFPYRLVIILMRMPQYIDILINDIVLCKVGSLSLCYLPTSYNHSYQFYPLYSHIPIQSHYPYIYYTHSHTYFKMIIIHIDLTILCLDSFRWSQGQPCGYGLDPLKFKTFIQI